MAVIIALAVFSVVLKAIALWKSARRNQKGWFVSLVILNTLGLLPVIYLVLNRKSKNTTVQKSEQ